jgi:ABC-type transport system involved in cytochrome c biogenesis permease subunit
VGEGDLYKFEVLGSDGQLRTKADPFAFRAEMRPRTASVVQRLLPGVAIDDARRADKAGGILLLVGVVNIPIIYFSVKWWNTLHQGSSVNLTKSSMATTMLYGMLLMAMCFWMYSIAVALMRARTIMLERERNTDWVKAELAGDVQ